jgi:hypothetical protein
MMLDWGDAHQGNVLGKNSEAFMEELHRVTKEACEMAGRRWNGRYDPGEAYWHVWKKISARAQREAKPPRELFSYGCRQARAYFWNQQQIDLRRKSRLSVVRSGIGEDADQQQIDLRRRSRLASASVSLGSLGEVADARAPDPLQELVEQEFFEYCRKLPQRTWLMLIAPFADGASRTACELNVSRQRVYEVHRSELEKLRRRFNPDCNS